MSTLLLKVHLVAYTCVPLVKYRKHGSYILVVGLLCKKKKQTKTKNIQVILPPLALCKYNYTYIS